MPFITRKLICGIMEKYCKRNREWMDQVMFKSSVFTEVMHEGTKG